MATTVKKQNYAVVIHYPIGAAEERQFFEDGNTAYPSECHELARFAAFGAAKSRCRKENGRLTGRAYAAIVDLAISSQLTPNRYGRYEGYET